MYLFFYFIREPELIGREGIYSQNKFRVDIVKFNLGSLAL